MGWEDPSLMPVCKSSNYSAKKNNSEQRFAHQLEHYKLH